MTLKRGLKGIAAALLLGAASLMPAAAQAETLKFISWQKDEAGVKDWWAALIAEFEARNPGTTIEWTKVDRGAYADTMMTLFAGGQPPDIVHMASFEFQQFANEGWLENLDPWIEQAGLDLNGWSGQAKCEWDDKTVCLMVLYFGYVMVYNDAIVQAEGLTVPTNYEELIEAARKATRDTNGDGIVDQFGIGHHTKGSGGEYVSNLLNYVLDTGARWTDEAGNVTINTPEMVEAFTRWKTVLQENLTPLDLTAAEQRQLIIEGRIAFTADGPWIYPIIATAPEGVREHLKVTASPFSPPVGGSSNVLAMASEISNERKKLVWDFIALAASDEFQTKYAEMSGSTAPSPRADNTAVKAQNPVFDLLVAAKDAASAAGVDRIPTGLEIQYNAFAKMVMEESQRMIIEDLDPADVVARIHELAVELQQS